MIKVESTTYPESAGIENTISESEADALEAELIERHLARTRLKHFVSRHTPNFLPGWHIDEICAAVELIEQRIQNGRGTDARLIVEAPPRHTKSQTISRCTPLWYLGRHPDHEVVVATYNQELADTIGRWAKMEIEDPSFKAIFPDLEIRKDSKAANRIGTTQGGGIRYVGVGAGLTGQGAHLAIIDDPIKDSADADSEAMSTALWDWYTSVLRTRLAPGGGIIILHTRWRLNDLIGRLVRLQSEGEGESFRRLTFAAIAEEDDPWGREAGEPLQECRYNAEDLEALRKSLPERDWLALYQQRPMAAEGNIFKLSDFQMFDPAKAPKNINWHIAADGAFSTKSSADYSCIWPFGIDSDGCLWFAPDFVHHRINTSEFIDNLLRLAARYNAGSINIEGGGFWRAIEPELNRRMRDAGRYYVVNTPTPTQDKFTRSRPLHARMQAGMARFPDTRYVREHIIPEFLVFTGQNDEHDDAIDTCAWAALASEKLVRPSDEYDEPEPYDESQGWTYDQMRSRIPDEEEAYNPNPHSPRTLRGEARQKKARWS